MLHYLFADGIDGVALCEVNSDSLATIRESLSSLGRFDCIDLTHKIGQSRWDLGFIYRRGVLRCRKGEPAVFTDRGKKLRSGHAIQVECDTPFYLYLSHWRSRAPEGANESGRKQQAQGLWRTVRKVIEDNKLVVLMGDFNDEPFDASMNEVLFTTRDPHLACGHKVPILYNPTWRLLAPNEPFSDFGTSDYKGASSNRHTLQQALVSHHFLDRTSRIAPTTRIHPVHVPHVSQEHHPLELVLPI